MGLTKILLKKEGNAAIFRLGGGENIAAAFGEETIAGVDGERAAIFDTDEIPIPWHH